MAVSDYAQTLEAIYRAAAEPSGWSGALGRVADFAGASGAMLVHNNLTGGEGSLVVGRLREDLSALYLREHADNPLSRTTLSLPTGRSYVGSRLAPHAVVRRSALYADILVPQGIEDQVVLPLDTYNRDGDSGGVGLTLNRRQADDAGRVAGRLDRLAPHLSRAVALTASTSGVRGQRRLADAILAAMPDAVLLLDARGAVLRANPNAERLLSDCDGLTVGPPPALRLMARLPEADRALQGFLRRAMATFGEDGTPFEQAMQVPRPSGHAPYLAVVTPLPPARFEWAEFGEPAARLLLQVTDPDRRAYARLALLQSAFGLTPAEARVARLVGSGMATPKVAAMLGLTPNTVRTHLARCFDKTGARTQVALSRLVSALSG